MVIIHDQGWRTIDKLFLDKARLFLIVLRKKWETAREEAQSIRNLLEEYRVYTGSRILDLGCGNGRVAINLARMGYNVVGLDYSRILLEEALTKAEKQNTFGRVLFVLGDALNVDEIFHEDVFDVSLIYWTTIIGYSLDPEIDRAIFSKLYRVTRNNGYLVILNHAVLEGLDYGFLSRRTPVLTDLGEYVRVDNASFDPVKSILHVTWVFYRRNGKNLIYFDEVSYDLKIYSTHEIIELAGKAGWKLENVYCDPKTLKPYVPGKCGLNMVLRKTPPLKS